jgi:hypothetical protein
MRILSPSFNLLYNERLGGKEKIRQSDDMSTF